VSADAEPEPVLPLQPLICGTRRLDFGPRTQVMGILNVTGDSFSGDGLLGDTDAAVRRGVEFVRDGASMLDVGGGSARADLRSLTVDEEIGRVCPVIERLARETDAVISIDSYKPAVIESAIAAGARFVNDISGFKLCTDKARLAAQYQFRS
jgi:dihydropteroate synthase